MNIKAQDLMNLMEEWAPQKLAESWDHPGLQVGNPEQPVKKVLISLDLTEENVDRAVKDGVSMIISHHPFLLNPCTPSTFPAIRAGLSENLSSMTYFPLQPIRIWIPPGMG